MNSFVLGFQERAGSERGDERFGDAGLITVLAGTKTLTEVRQEHVDEDPSEEDLLAFPK